MPQNEALSLLDYRLQQRKQDIGIPGAVITVTIYEYYWLRVSTSMDLEASARR